MVMPWTIAPGCLCAAASARSSHPAGGRQSSSVNATRGARAARQPTLRFGAAPQGASSIARGCISCVARSSFVSGPESWATTTSKRSRSRVCSASALSSQRRRTARSCEGTTTDISGALAIEGVIIVRGVPEVSVVVATRDRPGRLAALLESLGEQSLRDFEVVVVDDGSLKGLPSLPQGVRLIRHERPLGPSAARNTGWRAASAACVAFTDDDCVVSPGWLGALLTAARPGAIVQGPVSPIPSERSRLGPFSRSLWVDRLGPWYQAANMLYPRELLERLGGFDADAFPFAGEDCDLAWRAFAEGAEPVWAPDALVHHAVNEFGPAGTLRVALRWSEAVRLFSRHPALRREALTYGVFWRGSHYLLFRALVALALPRRLWPLRLWLGAPYARHLLLRGSRDGGGPLAAPWYALHDLVELAAVARGAARNRTLVL